ncbi:HAD-IB family hydrolase [Candidatus Zinderia endosymbiont of Aphrophora alni]|uniref:HAD family hydrolase n=1 Tax=Candidatus Zinderia endosymbiont of Aphrophora alni TaxID=3077951 RepID=UPI0030D13975
MNLCLFDLDKTLITVDSDYEWGKFLIKKNIVNIIDYHKFNEFWYQSYLKGNLNAKKYLKFIFNIFSKFSNLELKELISNYIEEIIIPSIKKEALNLINKHINYGDIIIIVTATNEIITKPISQLFNIKNLIAAIPQKTSKGIITGNLKNKPTYGIGKIINVSNWLKKKNKTIYNFKKSYFYSDSQSDIPLLSIVSNPIAINPNKKLKKYAFIKKWPIKNIFI